VNTDLSKIEEYMLFFRFIYLISSGNTAKLHHSYGAIPKELSLCMNIISQNATNGITLKQLSAETFLSISTIERLFKKHLLMTPMEFITDRKLSLAKDLLETNKSIAEISFECGFSDSSHFILAFKKKHNITPLKYRKLLEKH
jgi:AraC-like DNA-binding protein